MKKLILLGGILLLAAQIAGATDVYFRCDGTAGSGKVYLNSALTSPVAKGNLVQYIVGSVTQPDPNASDYLGGNNIKAGSNFIGDGTGGAAGTFYNYIPAFGKNVYAYARVWNQASTGKGPAFRYGSSDPFYVGDSVTPVKFNIPNFYLQYIADAPPAPTIKIDLKQIGYDVAKITFTGYSSDHEYSGIAVSYGTDPDATNGNVGQQQQALFLPGKPGEYLFGTIIGGLPVESGKKYYVKVAGINKFGASAYTAAPLPSFTTKAAPVGAVPKIYDLDIELGSTVNNANISLAWKADNAPTVAVWYSTLPNSGYVILKDNVSGTSLDTVIPKDGSYFFRVAPAGEFPIGAVNIPSDKIPFASETAALHTYSLISQTFGINTIAFPLKKIGGIAGTITTMQGIKEELSAQGVADADVRLIGKWDQTAQKAIGFKYNDATKTFDKMHAGSPAALTDVAIEMNDPIQITVAKDIDLVVVGKR
jgi:hypothetical protein